MNRLTEKQLEWCRQWLRAGRIEIFKIMEATRTVRVA